MVVFLWCVYYSGFRTVGSLQGDGKTIHTWGARHREINLELTGNTSLLASLQSAKRCCVDAGGQGEGAGRYINGLTQSWKLRLHATISDVLTGKKSGKAVCGGNQLLSLYMRLTPQEGFYIWHCKSSQKPTRESIGSRGTHYCHFAKWSCHQTSFQILVFLPRDECFSHPCSGRLSLQRAAVNTEAHNWSECPYMMVSAQP